MKPRPRNSLWLSADPQPLLQQMENTLRKWVKKYLAIIYQIYIIISKLHYFCIWIGIYANC